MIALRTTSHFVSPKTLFLIRLFFVALLLTYFIWEVVVEKLQYYRFLTNLSWMGILFYMVYATTATYNYTQDTKYRVQWNGIFDWLFASAATIAPAVTVIYWAALNSSFVQAVDSDAGFAVRLLWGHILNTVIMLIDLLLSRVPMKASTSFAVVLTMVAYVGYTILLKKVFGIDWPYGFMKTIFEDSEPAIVGVICVVGVIATILLFFVMYALTRLRDSLGQKKAPKKDLETIQHRQSYQNPQYYPNNSYTQRPLEAPPRQSVDVNPALLQRSDTQFSDESSFITNGK
ncbi:hypothetical protein EDD86DRAFT_199558 [Gorgonomyces haynaldii]|nr:hypothetical protein EDD86DRAFT_199558 [Gorgonomyces haynaldii]